MDDKSLQCTIVFSHSNGAISRRPKSIQRRYFLINHIYIVLPFWDSISDSCTLGSSPSLSLSSSPNISFLPYAEVYKGWEGYLEIKWSKFLLDGASGLFGLEAFNSSNWSDDEIYSTV